MRIKLIVAMKLLILYASYHQKQQIKLIVKKQLLLPSPTASKSHYLSLKKFRPPSKATLFIKSPLCNSLTKYLSPSPIVVYIYNTTLSHEITHYIHTNNLKIRRAHQIPLAVAWHLWKMKQRRSSRTTLVKRRNDAMRKGIISFFFL